MKTIEITIGPKGDVQLETRGFVGGSCRDVARSLAASLGPAVSERLTAEFYHSGTTQSDTLRASTASTPGDFAP